MNKLIKNPLVIVTAISLLLCIVFAVIAIIPYANGEINYLQNTADRHRQEMMTAYAEQSEYEAELEKANSALIRARLIYSNQPAKLAPYEAEVRRCERLIELCEPQISLSRAEMNSHINAISDIEDRSTILGALAGVFVVAAGVCFALIIKKQKNEKQKV